MRDFQAELDEFMDDIAATVDEVRYEHSQHPPLHRAWGYLTSLAARIKAAFIR